MNEEYVEQQVAQAVHHVYDKQHAQRAVDLDILNEIAIPGQIVFTGSSLMQQFPINELLMTKKLPYVIYNRAISGYTTFDMLENMDKMVLAPKPSKVFINIGTNDVASAAISNETMLENYETILRKIKETLPDVVVYVMAYYPVNENGGRTQPDGPGASQSFVRRNNAVINQVNEELRDLADRMGCRYINVNEGLTDGEGRLRQDYSVEGIHMHASGYQVVLNNLLPYLAE